METTDYSGMFIYKDDHLEYILTNEGRIKLDGHLNQSYPEYFIKDHLGNVRTVITSDPHVHYIVQGTDYYPFGQEIPVFGASDNQIKYNSKELQTEADLDWYDYGARFYDPVLGRWHSIDPMAETSRRWSPYTYCMNNPIRFIDPDGMDTDVYLTGEAAQEAFRQLQNSTNLSLTIDKLGKIEASGEAESASDKKLLEAINSKDVTVNIQADNSKTLDDGKGGKLLIVGGAFLGNTVETKTETTITDLGFEDVVGNISLETTSTSTIVSTTQLVNPTVLGAMDIANGIDGRGMLHETLESYEGGLISLKSENSSPMAGQPGSVWYKAHKRAPYQGGYVTGNYWDAKGNPLPTVVGCVKAEIRSNGSIIMLYP
jgi:RHS repeat-associated protein